MWFRENGLGRRGVRMALMGAALMLLLCGGVQAAQSRVHVVVKGESLSSVSRKHGLTVAKLAELNSLKPNAGLRIGQKLRVPGPEPKVTAPALPTAVSRSISSTTVRSGRWKSIVIHHSGTAEGSAAGMHHYHQRVRRMENGLAYHFVIGNGKGMKDGEVYVGHRWTRQLDGGHLASVLQNKTALGICLVGNFDQKAPTAAQMKSLQALVAALQKRCGLNAGSVTTHRDINVIGTRCPGALFPMSTLRKSLRDAK